MINYILSGLVFGAMLWVVIYLIRKSKQGGCAGCSGCGECSGCHMDQSTVKR